MKFSSLGRFAAGLFLVLFGACFMSGSYARPKPAASGYHLLKTVSLPAAPGGGEYYDYITVDAGARRVYVSHGTEVVVLNADDYSVVGKIEGLVALPRNCRGQGSRQRVHHGRRFQGNCHRAGSCGFRFEDLEGDGPV